MMILLPSCLEVHDLKSNNIQSEFEFDSGFKFPTIAKDSKIITSKSDFHGDYSMALTFVIETKDMPAFSSLAASVWTHPENFKPLTEPRKLFGGDASLRHDPMFIVPAGSLFIEQTGPADATRIYALDQSSGRIFYYRATW